MFASFGKNLNILAVSFLKRKFGVYVSCICLLALETYNISYNISFLHVKTCRAFTFLDTRKLPG